MTTRAVAESLVEMTEIILPEDTNPRGYVFGGRVLSLVDKCAAVVALRHARTEVATVSVDSVQFRTGARVGNVLVLNGRLNAVFRSSMEIEVEVHAEDPLAGTRTLTTRALVTMAALGPDWRPVPAHAIRFVTDEERERAEAAGHRRSERLARRD